MAPVNDYTPLAGYEPVMDMAIRETLFKTGVTAEQLRDGSLDISSSSNWPGFQFVLLMHDGERARAMSFWRNRRLLDNFVERYQAGNLDYVAKLDPNNPWRTGVESRNTGQSDIHVVDATMPALDGEVVIWSPRGAVRICEIRDVPDVERLRQWWPMIASPAVPDSLLQVSGFQFFTAVQYPDNCYTTYLGFSSRAHLDAYLMSELHSAHDGPFADPEFQRQIDVTVHTGELIAWFQRQVIR